MIGKLLVVLAAGAVGLAVGSSKKTKPKPAPIASAMWVLSGTNNGWMTTEKINEVIKKAAGNAFFMRRETDPVETIRLNVDADVIGSGNLPDGRRYFDVKLTTVHSAIDKDGNHPTITDMPDVGTIGRIADADVVEMSWRP